MNYARTPSPNSRACPICQKVWLKDDEALRKKHVNVCLDELHGLADNVEKSIPRHDKARNVFAIRIQSENLRSGRFSINHQQEKHFLVEEYPLPRHVWFKVTRFLSNLTDLRTCSRDMNSICEMEALTRLAKRSWFQILREPGISLLRGKSYVLLESHSRQESFECVPCINISQDGEYRGHVLFILPSEGFRRLTREWEAVTTIKADRALFATVETHVIEAIINSDSNFPAAAKSLRFYGLYVYEVPPPLTGHFFRVKVYWRGSFNGTYRLFGIPFLFSFQYGIERREIHAEIFARVKKYLKNIPKRRSPSTLLPYVLLTKQSDLEPLCFFPNDNFKLNSYISEFFLVLDFGEQVESKVSFDFFGPDASENENPRSLTSKSKFLLEAIIERDCGIRILQ